MLFIVELIGLRQDRGLQGDKLAYQEMLDCTETLRLAGGGGCSWPAAALALVQALLAQLALARYHLLPRVHPTAPEGGPS